MASRLLLLLAPLFLISACRPPEPSPDTKAPREEPSRSYVDEKFLIDPLWSDGRAEVAFYRVQRNRNQYGQEEDQSFMAGTYVVKQPFDRVRMSKAEPGSVSVSAFKYALFYEFQSRSYEYKRAWVVNAVQRTLEPLKASFTMFDWCSNSYEELAFAEDGSVAFLRRTDDYGNDAWDLVQPANTYPVAQLPLLVRALDFSRDSTVVFSVFDRNGKTVSVTARSGGVEAIEVEAGRFEAERVELQYGSTAPSVLGETADPSETYWRARAGERLLLRIEAASGRYRMELVEHMRSPYWSENLWPRLQRVRVRP